MRQIVVTTITWFILVSLFFYKQGYVWTNHDMLNLARVGPHLLKLVLVGPLLLKLVRVGRCLLNLIRAGRLIICGRGSGTVFVRDGRGRGRYGHGRDGDLVGCGRSAGQE